MEQDELKELWQAEQDQIESTEGPDTLDLQRESTSVIDKLRKRLKHEDFFNIVFFVLAIPFFLIKGDYLLTALVVVFVPPVLWYYRYLLNQLKHETFEMDVVQYLQKTHRIMKAFVLRYRIFGYMIVPIAFVWGIIEGATSEMETETVQFNDLLTVEFAIVALTILVIFMVFVELYIYFLYGKHVKKLKKLIDSLSQEE